MIYIAYCSDESKFHNDSLLSYEIASKFNPKPLTFYYLNKLIDKKLFCIHSGDVLIRKILSGSINPKDILLLQDINSKLGLKLLKLGAKSFYINCFESPLYAHKFYENYNNYVNNFTFIDCYKPILDTKQLKSNNRNHVIFPSYDVGELNHSNSIRKRSIVAIASNKFLPFDFSMINLKKPRTVLKYIFEIYKYVRYKQYRFAIMNSLNKLRLELLFFLSKNSILFLYGDGWSSIYNVPRKYRHDLTLLNSTSYFGVCNNKIEVLREHYFALCIENVRWPGYVTEKIIDCFVAGTIPIYYGAPDVKNIIPSNAFIDLADFASWNDLLMHINNLSLDQISSIQRAGLNFLSSPQSVKYSYQGTAQFIHKKILEFT